MIKTSNSTTIVKKKNKDPASCNWREFKTKWGKPRKV